MTGSEQPRCPTCGGRGWHTAGGNDPMACNCVAGEAWSADAPEQPLDLDALEAAEFYENPAVIVGALIERVRAAEGDRERLRELYDNQRDVQKQGWSIDHLMECEEALRASEAANARLAFGQMAPRTTCANCHTTPYVSPRCAVCHQPLDLEAP